MNKGLRFILWLSILRGVLACKHEPEPFILIVPEKEIIDSCSLKNVNYNLTIKPIFSQYCISCHSDSRASKGINFEGYDNIKIWFSLDTLRILHAIRHEKGLPMPLGGNKIPDCKIRQIEAWVKGGYKEN